MPKLTILPSDVGVDRVEANIKPPMPKVVTIPCAIEQADGDDFDIVLYVSHSAFDDDPPSTDQLRAVAREIVASLRKAK